MNLTSCQQKALISLNGTNNIFLTGIAGTGKTFLIQQFIKGLDRKTFPVLASTGAAAVIVKGRTFHSFFGLGIMEGGLEETINRACRDKRLKSRVKKLEGFVLDEVSMIPGQAMIAAETICRLIKDKNEPWGGVRVICVGDFAQLPPISHYSKEKQWSFLSPVWQESAFESIILKTIVRTEEKEFIEIQNYVREGIVNEPVKDFLNKKTIPFYNDYEGTCLFSRRKPAEQFNQKKLSEIPNELYSFRTEYTGKKQYIEILKKQAPITEEIALKQDAYVMLRINDPAYKYINGSTGHILEIGDDYLLIKLKNNKIVEIEKTEFCLLDADGEPVATATNFPVCLAYAITIHKAQGTTLTDAMIDLKRLWEPGQAYVALSRLQSSQGLSLIGWDKSSIIADSDVKRFYKEIFNANR